MSGVGDHLPVLVRGARVLTLGGVTGPRRGARAMGELGILASADVVVERGVVRRVGASLAAQPGRGAIELDARGRVLMPGFIDAHTHALWAGDRLDEWGLKRRGVAYLEILARGGGILSTVRAVRAASQAELARSLGARLENMLREGTTTVEVKSGYGLSTIDELKMLRAIRAAGASFPGTVIETALLGHAMDPEVGAEEFVRLTIEETLPEVSRQFPGVAVDAFCEQSAWTLDACVRLFDRAMALGHPVRVHADQFTALGMTEWAIGHGARSVDHLEATTPATLEALARSRTFGVMLPCTGFHTDGRYADGRRFIDAGGALVLATNCNPGSSPSSSAPLAMALGVRRLGLTPEEAIVSMTANAAALLGLNDRGWIGPGARADLVLLRHTDERELVHELGGNPVDAVICAGRVVVGDRS